MDEEIGNESHDSMNAGGCQKEIELVVMRMVGDMMDCSAGGILSARPTWRGEIAFEEGNVCA